MKCLESNKEDTANALEVIGELQEEKDLLKLQLNNIRLEFNQYKEFAEEAARKEKMAMTVGNVIIPATTIPMIIAGSILTATNNDYGKPILYSGLGLLIGCEIVWNGGHLIFHFW